MRPDGKRVKNLSAIQRITPYLMKTKHESLVYFNQIVAVNAAFDLVARLNRESGKKEYTLFTVILTAMVRIGKEYPELGRFFVGKRLYERNEIVFSFTAKTSREEDSKTVVVKVRFSGNEKMKDVAEKINREKEAISTASDDTAGDSDRILRLFFTLPSFIRSLFFTLLKGLNLCNGLPKSMIDSDPFFTACYIANLGSIGLGAPFHHLYEWGTASLFLAIGKAYALPVQTASKELAFANVIDLRFTLDDRITDGLYCSRALEKLKYLIEHPEELL